MNFKLNWGHSIAIVLLLFVLFIGNFVYKTLAKKEYNHELVSEEYYKDEIYYQEEIDRLNNATKLEENIYVKKSKKGLLFVFPKSFDFSKIKANISLQRNEVADFDIKTDIKLDSLSFLIPDSKLIKGRYNLKINWDYGKDLYQFREVIDY
jgi:hypothetical protein